MSVKQVECQIFWKLRHILLGRIDDGSRNTEESLAMLSLAGDQGVDLMLATPHFYDRHDRIERFLRRRHAWDKLRAAVDREKKEAQ